MDDFLSWPGWVTHSTPYLNVIRSTNAKQVSFVGTVSQEVGLPVLNLNVYITESISCRTFPWLSAQTATRSLDLIPSR
jgi:hypothetical protein